MAVDLSNYDIYVFRGNTYKLDFSYTDNNNIGIDLSSYEAKLQVRRSPDSPFLLGELTENFPTGSFGKGLSGDFVSGSGFTGHTGGIILNYSGVTGDVHIEIDSETTYAMKAGKYSYDFQIKDLTTGTKITILRGRMDVAPVSRIRDRLEPGFGGNEEITGESG